jgi:pimeloyl-ACP methyl ester carboxylesterase
MEELEGALPKISKIPTLVIWGSKDRTVDPSSAVPLTRCFESVQTAIINGAGHLPYEECPEEFCRIVTDFLTNRSPRKEREVT